MVDFPTRWAPDSLSSSLLGILVTNKPQQVRSIDSGAPLGSSDHLTVVIRLYHCIPQQAPGITPLFPGKEDNQILPIYKFRAVPPEKWQDIDVLPFFRRINKDLSCLPWHDIHQCASVKEAVAQFDNALQSVFREHLQQFRINHHDRPSFPKSLPPSQPPWLTPELRTAVKRKRDLCILQISHSNQPRSIPRLQKCCKAIVLARSLAIHAVDPISPLFTRPSHALPVCKAAMPCFRPFSAPHNDE